MARNNFLGIFVSDVRSQWCKRPPVPDQDFTGKTILVTGANIGYGKEASSHFVRLGASKVIMAVRSPEKGTAAKHEIESEHNRPGVIDVLQLDLSKYASVKAFAQNVAARFERIDIAIMNASIATGDFELFEQDESTMTVNVVSTIYLTVLLLPILRTSAAKFDTTPVMLVVGSGVHAYTSFPERNADDIFAKLNEKKSANMNDRYNVSKLVQLYAVREIAAQTANSHPFVVLNTLNPGLGYTGLTRNAKGAAKVVMASMRAAMAWTAEEGSRTLVHAVCEGPESHGVYISQGKADNADLAPFVTSEDGQKTQQKVWRQLSAKLERIDPGVTDVFQS